MDNIKISSALQFEFKDLFCNVDMDSDFTLRDVLNISINSQIPLAILEDILHCGSIQELWEEAYSQPFADKGDIEYLELKYGVSRHTYKKRICDSSGWSFYGVGKKGVIPKDLTENGVAVEDPENYRQGHAIEFSPMYELADYPIHFDRAISFENYDVKKLVLDDIPVRPQITLAELLYAVFWELTFCGDIQDREDKLAELKGTIESFEKEKAAGTLKTIPFEDVKRHFEEKFGSFDDMDVEENPDGEEGGKDK